MTTPVVSIIIPARDMARYIADTLVSALTQSVSAIEVIVIDDGSVDETAAIVAGFADPRIRLLRNAAGAGVSAARNTGLRLASSPYILFLDADDILMAGALDALLAPLQNNADYVAAMGRIVCMTEEGETLQERPRRIRDVPAQGTLRHLLAKNFIQPGTLLVRAEAARAAGSFRTDLAYGEDWEYWCRLALIGDFLPIDHTVLKYRLRSTGAHRLKRGTLLAPNHAAIRAIYENPAVIARFRASDLARIRRTSEIDAFWTGVRSEIAFGSKLRALSAGFLGLARYPDSVLKPRLAYYFLRSLVSAETRTVAPRPDRARA